MQKPISACLLVYNHAHLISSTIESILNQTYKNFELIISDDNSTDNSFEIIQSYANKCEQIVPIQTPSNLGMAGNSNFAISKALNEYIALLHHDDLLRNDAFAKWMEIIEKSDNIAFVFNDYSIKGIGQHFMEKKKFHSIMEGKKFLSRNLLKSWGCPVRGTTLFRKKYFQQVNGMDLNFALLADVDLWMRLSAKWDVGYVNEPLIEVRQERPENYPKIYTEFSWERKFILFDIHSSNLNKDNYSNFLHHLFKRFVFRNKVSIEIIKWHLYALLRNKNEILVSYPGNYNYELFYSKYCRYILKKVFMKN